MSSSIINIKSNEKDPLLDIDQNNVINVSTEEQSEKEIKFHANSRPFFINTFTANFGKGDQIRLYNNLDKSNTGWAEYASSSLAYSIQSLFFKTDAAAEVDYVTHPWNGSALTALHCISFSNNIYNDKLLGFNSDIILSITGSLSSGGNLIGFGSYDDPVFVYTEELETFVVDNSFVGLRDNTKGVFQQLDNHDIDYSIIACRLYYNLSPVHQYYNLKGVVLKDYGLIILFDNTDNWNEFNDMMIVNATSTSAGTITNPAVYWNFLNEAVFYKYQTNFTEKRVNANLNWIKANYSSNKSARNDDTSKYKFLEIDTLNQLNEISKEQQPRTYITKIYLYDEEKDLVAVASLLKPTRKDFLTNIDFKIRMKI